MMKQPSKTNKGQPHKGPNNYTRINHELGFFLDPAKYVPLQKINDEASVMLRLCLIIENFLEVYINNVRPIGTEAFVKPARYFMPKVELSVALKLPISIAEALVAVNAIRNKFAHKIEYVMSSDDYERIENAVNSIDMKTINPYGIFNIESLQYMFEAGVDSLVFIRDQQYAMTDRQRKMQRLIGAVFILSNKCAFFTLSELANQGRLKFQPPV